MLNIARKDCMYRSETKTTETFGITNIGIHPNSKYRMLTTTEIKCQFKINIYEV